MSFRDDSFNEFDDKLIDFANDWEVQQIRFNLLLTPEFQFDNDNGKWHKLSDCSDAFKRDFYDIFEGLNR